MSMLQEETPLCDAVRTMMAQICKVGVVYSMELLIEATIVITVDRHKAIVVHFDDRLPPQSHCQIGDVAASSSQQDLNLTDVPRALELQDTCANSTLTACVSSSASLSSRPGWYEGSSTSKMMNCLTELDDALRERVNIDVDSDSQAPSLADVEDAASCSASFRNTTATDVCSFSSTPTTSGGSRKTFRRVKDAKNVIIIEDNELFDVGTAAGDLSETFDDFNSGELKSLTSFAASTGDCESISDVTESRSIFRDFSPEASSDSKRFEPAALACEMCGWQAHTLSQLESHLVGLHGVIESQRLGRRIAHFACQYCGKRYRFRTQLDKHRLQHDSGIDDRPHRCQQCRNSYRHARSLALHARVHDKAVCGARLHCQMCQKTYPNKVLFQKHIVYMHERTSGTDDVSP